MFSSVTHVYICISPISLPVHSFCFYICAWLQSWIRYALFKIQFWVYTCRCVFRFDYTYIPLPGSSFAHPHVHVRDIILVVICTCLVQVLVVSMHMPRSDFDVYTGCQFQIACVVMVISLLMCNLSLIFVLA